ncbi:hypothetical protein ACTHGU_08410 [Chitinophagaceae bacterium MMS25-I14]
MKDIKVKHIVVVLPTTSKENSCDFYIRNLGFKLSPSGDIYNENLSINFIKSGDNLLKSNEITLDDCKLVLQYEDLSLIDLSKFDIVNDSEVPYGRFVYVKDVSGNLICLSELYTSYDSE